MSEAELRMTKKGLVTKHLWELQSRSRELGRAKAKRSREVRSRGKKKKKEEGWRFELGQVGDRRVVEGGPLCTVGGGES